MASATTPPAPKDFKAFDRMYAQIKRANRAERLVGVGLLTPQLLKQHIKSGKDLVLAYGRQGTTLTYTLADLKAFSNAIKRVEAEHRADLPGVPLMQLEAMSRDEDKERVKTIASAMFYRINGNILNFQVSASPGSSVRHHQVKVRLDSWYQHMLSAPDFQKGAKLAAVGNISFDCSCGRHQYWYRYLATLGNFAVAPYEKDFPKIRNPKLTGCCCKHVLKVLRILKSGTIHGILAKEMEKQAAAPGYVDKRAKYLSKTTLKKVKQAKGTDKDIAEAKRAYRDFRKAKKAFLAKLNQKDVQELIQKKDQQIRQTEVENLGLKKQVKVLQKQAADAKREAERKALADRVADAISLGNDLGVPRETILQKLATKVGVDVAVVEQIAKEQGV